MSDLKWRIYYDDDTTFDNTMAEPKPCPTCKGSGEVGAEASAPKEGVIAINYRDSVYDAQTRTGYNMYIYDSTGEQWFSTNDEETTMRRVPNMVMGRMTSVEHLRAITNRACKDTDFPKRSPRRRVTDGNYEGNIERQADIRRIIKRVVTNEILAEMADASLPLDEVLKGKP